MNNYKYLKTKERESDLKTKDLNNYKSSPSDHNGIVHTPQQNPKIKREKEREAKCKIPWGRPEGQRCRSWQHVEVSKVRKDSRPSVSVTSFDPIGLISDA